MEETILTPLQLWNGFRPEEERTEIAFRDYRAGDDGAEFGAYACGGVYGGKQARVWCEGFVSAKNPKEVLVYAGDYFSAESLADLRTSFGDRSLLVFDYCGAGAGLREKTRYPQAAAYGNLASAGQRLFRADPTARETCVFLWSRVCRYVLGVVKQIFGADSKIVLLGVRNGADIAWQTAAMDARADALAVIGNAGWKEFADIPRYGAHTEFAMDDERERWLMACAPQSYAKLVNKPTLFLGASNGDLTSVDRLESTLAAIPDSAERVRKFVCAGRKNSLDEVAARTLASWLTAVTSGGELPRSPEIRLSVEEGKLIAELDFSEDEDVAEAAVYYNCNEADATLRDWKKLVLPLGNRRCEIPLYADAEFAVAFGNVVYKKGFGLSSYVAYKRVAQEDLFYTPLRKSHIIFEKKNGVGGWVAEDETSGIFAGKPQLLAGGLDILGISASSGNLITYAVGDPQFRIAAPDLLKFDVYAKTERVGVVSLIVSENGARKRYSASFAASADKWTKCALEAQDFKSAEMQALKSWKNVKKLVFERVGGLIFNNILWV